jgi:chemotaxis protein methyltransferase CheR
MTPSTWSNSCHEAITALLRERTGLAFPSHRRADCEQAIRRAMAKAGLQEAAIYLDKLRSGAIPLDDLVDEVTIGETYFFREQAQFAFIRDVVLPEFITAEGRSLRIWSAGCASGEEPYSLAILCEMMGLAGRTSILATDIAQAALNKARAGSYTAWSFRGDTTRLADRYFSRHGDCFRLDERIRRRVSFHALNLVLDPCPPFVGGVRGMDLVLCRNVLIYFDPDIIIRVAARLMAALADGGWLITGPSDPLLPLADSCRMVVTPSGIFYRRDHRVVGRPAARAIPVVSARGEHSRGGAADPGRAAVAQAPGSAASLSADPGSADPGSADPETADPAVCAARIRTLADLGDTAGAERAAAESLAAHPRSTELRFLRALLLIALGRETAAAGELRRVLYLDRSLAMAHVTQGLLCRRADDLAGARRAFGIGHKLAAAHAAEDLLPLSDGQQAGQVAAAAWAQLAALGGTSPSPTDFDLPAT